MGVRYHGAAPLGLEAAWTGSGVRLTPAGELDLATAERLAESVRAHAATVPGEVTLDLSALQFIDITGARAVLELAQELAGRLSILPGGDHVQRVFELTGIDRRLRYVASDNLAPFPAVAARNLRYVRKIWTALAQDGIEAVIRLTPPGVEWLPWGASGRILHGPEELRAFYPEPAAFGRGGARDFTSLGDDVLVHVSIPQADGSSKDLFSLYQFDCGTLQRATRYEHEADARAAAS